MKSSIRYLFIGLALLSAGQVLADDITEKEKRIACKAIIDTLDYDEGTSVSLCMDGNWIISDIETGSGNRQVSFSWTGKASLKQSGDDHCAGYVLTHPSSSGKKVTLVTDLDCK